MILNQNDTARLQAFTEARKHGIYIPCMFIVETGNQNVGCVWGKKPYHEMQCAHDILTRNMQDLL